MAVATLPESLLTLRTGPSCPHCDMQLRTGDALCHACGATLGEPPRRSGMTQRALALNAESAAAILAAKESVPVAVAPVAARSVVRSWRDVVLLVCTLGLGWFWLARRS